MIDTKHIEVLRKRITELQHLVEYHAIRNHDSMVLAYRAEQAALRAIITVALDARASAGEGGEWVLVPREPTPEMLRDMSLALHDFKEPGVYPRIRSAYIAMLTAAPQPQADECPACKLGQATCGYHTRNPTAPPAHGDEKHLADCLLMTGYLSREQAEEVASKLRAFVFTPASPATGESSPFTCDECGKVECCPEFHESPQPERNQLQNPECGFTEHDLKDKKDEERGQ